jgi:hypothetical protein
MLSKPFRRSLMSVAWAKKFLQIRSNIRIEGDEEKKDNVQKAEEAKDAKVPEAAKKEEKDAAETVKKAKEADGSKGPDAAVAGAEGGATEEAKKDAAKSDTEVPKGVPASDADKSPCE